MSCERRAGNRQALDAIAVVTGVPRGTLVDEFHTMEPAAKPGKVADEAAVVAGLERIANTVRQAPLTDDTRALLLHALADAAAGNLSVNPVHVHRWRRLLAAHPISTPTIVGTPVRLPNLGERANDALETLLQIDASTSAPWALIGGLMVAVHCTEHEYPMPIRPTNDGDIGVSVFTKRSDLFEIITALKQVGYVDATPDPMTGKELVSYRWQRGQATIDVMVPPRTNITPHPPSRAASRAAVACSPNWRDCSACAT